MCHQDAKTPNDVTFLQLEEKWRQDLHFAVFKVDVPAPCNTAQNITQAAQHISASKAIAGRS